MGMNPHRRAIDHDGFVVAFRRAQGLQDRVPQTVFGPRPKSVLDRLPGAELLGQVTPRRAGAQNPKNRFDSGALILALAAALLGPTQALPMGFNFFSFSQSPSARRSLGG